ncbi:hypothetical protein AFLA_012886 [Aspergillus flavus NRRL3357]|nr:hypothetical protein AFLA_012886 [Aspergillus flavus NRRL3357]
MASDAASQVSVGALSAIFDETKPQILEPVVQCVQIKPLPPQQNNQERYRAVFSDISNYVQTMLATPEANRFVTSGQLRKGCFVRLKSFQANSVKGKKHGARASQISGPGITGMEMEGSVYYISSPCGVKLAKKQFTNLNNDYELTFERDTVVEKAEDQADVPQIRFSFTTIGDLQSVEKDTTIDVIGVLKEVAEVSQIMSKTTNKPYNKRELTLVDSTGFSVRLTVWGSTALNFNVTPESLSLLSSGSMTVDPDIEEAHKLKGWYDAQGRDGVFASHASMPGVAASTTKLEQFKTVAQVKEEQLGMSDEVAYFSLKATVIYIKQDTMCYPACLSEGCNKKVTELDPGQWRCERCDKTHPRPEYRYIMLISVSDHTGQLYLSCFDEVGRYMMGTSADQLMEIRQNDDKAAGDIFQDANCRTWNFRCRAKIDNFGDQQRIRCQIVTAKPVNYSEEALRLANMIDSYSVS